jgi:DNA-directed RNA polymerase subunit RPC12/RpoP
MHRRLVVSTECPTCGAPLHFKEGSNAVCCEYCRSNLLVTGRKQVLSYYVAPELDPRDAARNAWIACREKGWRCRATNWERYFVPYYRLVGHDLRWEKKQPERELRDQTEDAELRRLFSSFNLRASASLAAVAPRALRRQADDLDSGTLRDRYVDKNFVAASLQGAGVFSLGIRLSVLKLRLFNSEEVRALGRVVAPSLAPDKALSQGMSTAVVGAGILQRKVLGRMLSVIYYPLCVVEVDRQGETLFALVDGVSGTVLQTDADVSLQEVLRLEPKRDPHSVGFRPLTCPNCGWDLPVEPEFVIFFCNSCERAWEIVGADLRRVSHEIANVPPTAAIPTGQDPRFLPFWVLKNGQNKTPPHFFVPAFRYRRLKHLVDLARDMSGKDRTYNRYRGDLPALHGCYYDQEDAVRLAEITYPGMSPFPKRIIERLREDPLSLRGASLTWFPFRPQANSLRDPFTGRAISERLLI